MSKKDGKAATEPGTNGRKKAREIRHAGAHLRAPIGARKTSAEADDFFALFCGQWIDAMRGAASQIAGSARLKVAGNAR